MFKKLFSNEKGVSPVIGVMLMIVVTVILAAAVSAYSSGVESQEAAPQGTFAVSADNSLDTVTFEHLGGDTLYKSDLKIEITHGSTGGYVNMSNVTFAPHTDYLEPGDVATIQATSPGWGEGISFIGDDIKVTAPLGDRFIFSLIDKESGQTIYSTKVTVNP